MKNKTIKVIACAAIMALALSATACGGSDDSAKTEDSTNVESTEDTADTEQEAEPEAPADSEDEAKTEAEPEADAADGDAEYSTLEDYYSDPSVKSALDAAFGSLAQDGMALSIDVKGNVFTITCKFEDSSVVVDGIDEILAQGLEANAAQFESQAAAFDEAVGQSGACTVAVRYTDPDDNVLAEGEYTAK